MLSATIYLVSAFNLGAQGSPTPDTNQVVAEQRIRNLEGQIQKINQSIQNIQNKPFTNTGGTAFWLFGAFCALWAQNTNRNPWLWFFLGLFFNVITVIVLLIKNAGDRRPPDTNLFSDGRRR
jgi:hypothetical protein